MVEVRSRVTLGGKQGAPSDTVMSGLCQSHQERDSLLVRGNFMRVDDIAASRNQLFKGL